MQNAKFPIRLRVAAPCNADWNHMAGDDRVRFCGDCKKDVYNLSAMTEPDARALLASRGQNLCVRFYQRADGTVLTQDCPVGVRRRRLRRIVALTSGVTLVGAFFFVACKRNTASVGLVGPDAPARAMTGSPTAVVPEDLAVAAPPVPALMGRIAPSKMKP